MGGYVLGALAIFLCISGTIETTVKHIEYTNTKQYAYHDNYYHNIPQFAAKICKNPSKNTLENINPSAKVFYQKKLQRTSAKIHINAK